jgi:flagellar hook-associated protein 3 FlgL
MMINSFMGNINNNMSLMQKYQDQLSSGRRILNLSDDPIGIMASMDAKLKLRKLDMHNASIGDAKSWLAQTETSLNELNDVLSQVYENTVNAANGTMTTEDKQATAKLIEQLRQHVVQIGNASYGGRYIFGGYNTTSEPFTADPATGALLYDGVDLATAAPAQVSALQSQVVRYSTGVNITTDVSLNGVDLMGSGTDNLDKLLGDLIDALNSGANTDSLTVFVGKLQGKQQDILSQLAVVGRRTNRLDLMEMTNADDELNYTDVLSKVEDVDQAQATMNFKMAEAIYRAALDVGARVIQPTLMDFLR